MAVVSLPGIYLGIQKDFMVQFDRYADIERGLPSTFFFIPYKNRPGMDLEGRSAKGRAVKYDIGDIVRGSSETPCPRLRNRSARHRCLAQHGEGADERMRVSRMIDRPGHGHPHALAVLFGRLSRACWSRPAFPTTRRRATTMRSASGPERPRHSGCREQHSMSCRCTSWTRRFFLPDGWRLSEAAAFERIKEICCPCIGQTGGPSPSTGITEASGPERFWDELYIHLLEEMEKNGAWFATAREAVSWFDKRRSAVFRRVERRGAEMHIQLACPFRR